MNKQEFIRAIRQVVRDSAVTGTTDILRAPPGRRSDVGLVQLAQWFNSLPSDQQAKVADVARLATDQAVFGFLCVLDGVRQIENDSDKGKLVLTFEKHGAEVVLNEDTGTELHDLFKMETTG